MVKYVIESVAELPKGARYAAWECKMDEPAFKWIPMGSIVNGKELSRGRWLKISDADCAEGPFEAGYLRRGRLSAKTAKKEESKRVKIEKKKTKLAKMKDDIAALEKELLMFDEEEKESPRLPTKKELKMPANDEEYETILRQAKEYKKWKILQEAAREEVAEDSDATESELDV